MLKKEFGLIFLIILFYGYLPAREALSPPGAPKKPKATAIHGETLTDDYYWISGRYP